MRLNRVASIETHPLEIADSPMPEPREGEILVGVDVCGVCRTDLHVVEGDLPPKLAGVIPGHEVVGRVTEVGPGVSTFSKGETVGIPWLHHTCGQCEYCRTGRENLCDRKTFTGYDVPGGYADFVKAEAAFALRLPEGDPAHLAPWLCAGLIGYRALKLALPRPGGRIGFFGFGGSAHLTLQLAAKLGYETIAYTRNPAHAALAQRLGASETVIASAESNADPLPRLDGAVVFSPAGESVVQALRELRKGGTLSIAAIHMSPIPSIDYDRYFVGERKIQSVEANTREDAREFLDLAGRLHLESIVTVRKLSEANEALIDLKHGRVDGAAVLDCRAP